MFGGRCWLVVAFVAAACSARNPAFDEPTGSGTDTATGEDASETRADGGPGGRTADTGSAGGTGDSGDADTGSPDASDSGTTGDEFDPCGPFDACRTQSTFAGGECDPYNQDCAKGFKCIPVFGVNGQATTQCVAVPPQPAAPTEPCLSNVARGGDGDGCELGSVCWAPDEKSQGTCVELCTCGPDQPVCEAGRRCFQTNDDVIALCPDPCDPLAPDCGDRQVCVLTVAPNGGTVTACVPSLKRAGSQGDSCDALNGCSPGLMCAAADIAGCGGASCCLSICDPEDPMACESRAKTCLRLVDLENMQCLSEFGVCV